VKIVVIGLGSMGKRRIRLIQRFNPNFKIYGIDLNHERRSQCELSYSIETSDDLNALFKKENIDCAFVCTSPLTHAAIIEMCLGSNVHVFTELNLVSDGYDKNIALSKKKEKVLFLSSTFLYRDEIHKIEEIVDNETTRLNYTYHVGQYLPDWHPWEHFTEFFVSDKRTNGCREIFAIELPWLTKVFGTVKKIQVMKSNLTSLNLDYPDNYSVIFEHVNGSIGTLAVDVVSRKPVRNLEVFNENIYFSWNGSPDGLKVYDTEQKKDVIIELYDHVDTVEGYSNFIIENAYYNEITTFFEMILNNNKSVYDFEKDKAILKLIDEIEAYNEKAL